MPVMIRFNDNWADEMDIEAMTIDTKCKTAQESEDRIFKGLIFPTSINFGTNEYNDYDTKEQLLECFSFTEISDSDVEVLNRLGMSSVGNFPNFYNYEEIFDEEENAK